VEIRMGEPHDAGLKAEDGQAALTCHAGFGCGMLAGAWWTVCLAVALHALEAGRWGSLPWAVAIGAYPVLLWYIWLVIGLALGWHERVGAFLARPHGRRVLRLVNVGVVGACALGVIRLIG
jgi:hypothetical protein